MSLRPIAKTKPPSPTMKSNGQSTIQAEPRLATTVGHCHYGQYPQTVAAPEAVAAMATRPDADGYFHSDYDGQRYAKVEVSAACSGKLSDGTELQEGQTLFFLVEPIEWWVLPCKGCRLLVSRRVLTASAFDQESNQWQSSTVRAYMQQWVVQALTQDEQRRLVDLSLDNNSEGCRAVYCGRSVCLMADMMPWCRQPACNDAVFLLSKPEYDSLRQGGFPPFYATDYAKATGAFVKGDDTAVGWLRSAESAPDRAFVFGVEDKQSVLLGLSTGRRVDEIMGVAPVICLAEGQK